MTILIPESHSPIPLSLTGQIPGYRVRSMHHHFRQEVWVYYLFGLPQVPIGTREGWAIERLLDEVVERQAKAGQGIIHLRIQHERNLFTMLATAFTLSLMSPTALIIEGDVVDLQRVQREPEEKP